ncbi:MAG: heme ABC transporter permease [Pseudomonadota bacterium]|nr:heme ABC transporter permease [Pseudomonadota bacterium]
MHPLSTLSKIFHQLSSPPHAYRLATRLMPWLGWATTLCFALGLYGALVFAPPDYQQGDGYRIIFVHVPAAWMSMWVYIILAVSGLIGLVWHIKVAFIVARASAFLGAAYTFLALVTGSIWGKPMWGTWWVWDARLTSELVLLLLYLGYIALDSAIEDRRAAGRACAILALVGLVNIPIIHFSVDWWNTLHQGATVSKLDTPSIHVRMLLPLLIMALAFKLHYLSVLMLRLRAGLLTQEKHAVWISQQLPIR